MTNFDIPNGEEVAPNRIYNYDLLPEEYDISKNRSTNTYDQFIMLRDTLVYSKKYYKGKAGSVLVIWDTEETVEVIVRNRWVQKFNPDRESDPDDIQTTLQWPYITREWVDQSVYGPASCRVTKSGYYKLTHKEEVMNIPTGTTKIIGYIERLPMDAQWGNWQPGTGIKLAVYDDESNTYTLDELYTKKTVIWMVDTNLEEGDILVFHIEDQDGDSLPLQWDWSNRWTVDYINLPLND